MAKTNQKLVRGEWERIVLAEVQAAIAELLRDGMIKIVGIDAATGEPRYAINEDWKPPRPH